jgi:putative transposase
MSKGTSGRRGNGSEFISRDLALRAYQLDVIIDFSRPGKPADNAFIESFNGKFRAECQNRHWFLPLDHARKKMEEWFRAHNEARPHSAISTIPPISLMTAPTHPVRGESKLRGPNQHPFFY